MSALISNRLERPKPKSSVAQSLESLVEMVLISTFYFQLWFFSTLECDNSPIKVREHDEWLVWVRKSSWHSKLIQLMTNKKLITDESKTEDGSCCWWEVEIKSWSMYNLQKFEIQLGTFFTLATSHCAHGLYEHTNQYQLLLGSFRLGLVNWVDWVKILGNGHNECSSSRGIRSCQVIGAKGV